MVLFGVVERACFCVQVESDPATRDSSREGSSGGSVREGSPMDTLE